MFLSQQQNSDKEFHTDGLTVEKAHYAVVLSRQHGMTRSRRLADRSCCRDVTLKVGWQKSIRYCGAWQCMQLYIMTLSLRLAQVH